MIKIKCSNSAFMIWNAHDVIYLRKNYRIVGNLSGTLPNHPRQNDSQGLPLVLTPEEARLLSSLNVCQIIEQSFPDYDDNRMIEMNLSMQSHAKERSLEKYREERRKQIMSNLDRIVDGKLKKCLSKPSGEDLKEFRQKTLEELLLEVDNIIDMEDQSTFYIESPFSTLKFERPVQLETLVPFSLNSLKYLTFKHFWSQGYFLTDGLKFGAHFLAYDHDPLMFHAKFIIVCCPKTEDFERFQSRMLQAFGRLGKNVRKNVIVVNFDTNSNKEIIRLNHIQWNSMIFSEDNHKK